MTPESAELAEGELIELVPLTLERSRQAAGIAAATGVRGADAVYVALARELDESLVTLDRRLSFFLSSPLYLSGSGGGTYSFHLPAAMNSE